MTRRAIIAPRVLTPEGIRPNCAVLIEGHRIIRLVDAYAVPADYAIDRFEIGTLVPGFVDLQVNGGGGVLFNDQPTVDGIATIAAAHRRFGTTAMLPTLISDNLDVVARAIAAVDDAIEQGVPGVLGIHIEGPFLNVARKGIHDASKFATLDEAAVDLLSSLRTGKTLVTLAPDKGADRLCLVSDAMPSVGSDLDRFHLGDVEILVQGGRCVDAAGTLAGCHLDMASALRGMMNATGCTLNQASNMASRTPADFLGLAERLGSIQLGQDATFLLMDDNLMISMVI